MALMAGYCWITKLIFLLLLISRALHVADTRPARGSPTSDLIAGNEFLKLFMERDDFERSLHSAEQQGLADAGSLSKSSFDDNIRKPENDDTSDVDATTSTGRFKARNNARSLNYKAYNNGGNSNRHTDDNADGKQVVKLVTSGSKIVFLEEYDEADDAIVDAVARDIDLKREKIKKVNHKTGANESRFYQDGGKTSSNDEFKVVAVSVSSSSKRHQPTASEIPKQVSKFSIKSSLPGHMMESRYGSTLTTTTTTTTKRPTTRSTKSTMTTTTTSLPLTTTVATTMSTLVAASNHIDDFINRSHKSEFSIEEAEPLPLTMPQKLHKMRRAHAAIPDDSQNSASTSIQNVLASPALMSSASVRSSSVVPASVNRNSTTQAKSTARQARINQNEMTYDSDVGTKTDVNGDGNGDGDGDVNADMAAGDGDAVAELVKEKLLPFQTVIYHDTKEGHGPQSRSISYSSISQNVEDLQAWRHTGILAEAQRNVSESLKPMLRSSPSHGQPSAQHESEPAKFYSVPSKMYSIPSKFYSEPAKVYSQPSKNYGEPEKFYSEPSKVYSQPSKFYSEPAKVYSQPSKVYGEPAKTYWPQTTSIITTTTSTSTTTATVTPASQSIITTFSPFATPFNLTSRRPAAIVSRIAFGEAQSSSQPTIMQAELPAGVSLIRKTSGHHHENYQKQNQYQSHGQGQQSTQSRRVLFNLDKLPYDLLNAPEQQLLEPDSSKIQANPCSEPAAALATLSNTQQQQEQHQQQQRKHLRQHSSFADQHSNQNAKGLPNRDLVKCVSKFSVHHSPTAHESAARRPPSSSVPERHYTTERSHIDDELYRPTPEQNYEIEESVSVMTNGRAHIGIQGIGGLGAMTATSTTVMPPKLQSVTHSRMRPGATNGALRIVGHAKINKNLNEDNAEEVHLKNNNKKNNHHHYANNNDYSDDNGDDDGDGDGDIDGDDGSNTGDDDDSKVAYVVEGRNYRKYRVEEKTDDGFIVGEFGVVDHNDGNLRGVRYTADSTINPSLIQKALLTFLKLK